jgi:DNA-binding NarL/FixJ family response regulator
MQINGLSILIVEDSNLIFQRMKLLLSELDCISRIIQSADGFEALTALKELKPDVVLLDINLPGKSGISILKEIKSSSEIKVVMLSNYSDDYYRTLCASLGADHFLDKSTEFDQIATVLEKIHCKVL